MNRTVLVAALILAFTTTCACSNQGGVTLLKDTLEVATADGNATPGDAAVETRNEVAADGWLVTDTTDVADTTFEPNDFGQPCRDNDDCLSGLCIPHRGELVCSHECVEECPAGFTCQAITSGGPDMFFACVSLTPSLCLPCATNDDCEPGPGVPTACVVYPGEGSFCATLCTDKILCPEGSYCLDADSVDGESDNYCVLQSGSCPCTQFAIATGLGTPCEVANEFGTCSGNRTCTEEGLSQCDSEVPNEEFCNGSDDNCDGQIDEGTCNDGNPCTLDECQPNQGCIFEPQEGMECDDGDPCTVAELCLDGNCQGTPVICNDDNPCTDDICDIDGGCSFEDNQAECDDDEPCTVGDFCKAGSCSGTPIACDCAGDADCVALDDDNVCNGTLFCDDSKLPYQCQTSPDSVVDCPAPEGKNKLCLAAFCNPLDGSCSLVAANNGTPCDDENGCTYGEVCSEGSCLGGKPLNCNDGDPCTDDSCQPGLGCTTSFNDAPCDDGNFCTINDLCADGACAGGGPLDCDDNNACTNDICNPVKGCLHTNNSQPCDDLDPCTEQDSCSGGLCLGAVPKDCSDDNPCTDDICIPLAGCSYNNNSNPCDDGNPCTVTDQCLGGSCNPGSLFNCDDGDNCTLDSCDPESGLCQHAPSPDGECDDANPCTLVDQCIGGKCIGSVPPDCDDENVCTTDYCDPTSGCVHLLNSAPCDDGNLCTTKDQCNLGQCAGGPALTCIDNNPCTDDGCGPESGCSFTPNIDQCDDGNACTEGDVCKSGWCSGATVNCNDLSPCTADSCDPGVGCLHLPADGSCNDGDACTSDDLCADGLCTGGPAVNCNDGNVCTEDGCDADTGCTNTATDGSCDDEDACTVGDFCADSACQAGPDTLGCDDNKLCTDDSCDPDLGCININNASACDDNNECTVGDICADGVCTAGPDSKDCDDNDPCTTDTCDPDAGCQHTGGGCIGFKHAFAAGPTTATACNKWNAFRATLNGNYSKVTIKGTYDQVGVSCTGASANAICNALRTNSAGSWNCNGREWRTGQCGGAIEVNAMGNMCGCPGNAYTVRPCIDYPGSPNPNWGAAKTESCNSPAQTLELICQ
jgi:hypothetical protein